MCKEPKYWTAVVLQGCGNMNAWITSVKLSYSLNGMTYRPVNDGRSYSANSDRNTKLRIEFERPVFGRAIRIHPEAWKKNIALRFDALYIDTVLD